MYINIYIYIYIYIHKHISMYRICTYMYRISMYLGSFQDMRDFLCWDIIDIMYIYLMFHDFVVGPYAQCRELFVFMYYIHIYT